jgi:hypothetical protein
MRFTPNMTNWDGSARFTAGARPPLDMLPPKLATLLSERDTLAGKVSEADKLVRDLQDETLDLTAKQTDDQDAALAARSRKPIPAPVAADKLKADRLTAERDATAQKSAFEACTQEANAMVDVVRDETTAAAEAQRTKARTEIEAIADKLADKVEAAVLAGAIQDWLTKGSYYRDARTWITDVCPDSARYGIGRSNTTHYAIRDLIRGCATTTLED